LTGGIATTDTFVTTTAFDAGAFATAVAVTLSGNATGTVDLDGAAEISAVNITSGGTGYTVGDTVIVNEDGGLGAGSFRVASIT